MYDGKIFCEVFQCFSRDHDRNDHVCERCKEIGHGHRECPKKNYGLTLKSHLIPKDIVDKLKDRKETKTVYDNMNIYTISSGMFGFGLMEDRKSYFVKNSGGIYQCIIVTAEQNDYIHKKNLRYENIHFFRHFVNRYTRA